MIPCDKCGEDTADAEIQKNVGTCDKCSAELQRNYVNMDPQQKDAILKDMLREIQKGLESMRDAGPETPSE